MQSEGFQYLAGKVYEEKTGKQMEFEEGERPPPKPAGEKLDFGDEEEMRPRFPRLLAKMPEMGD